VTEPQSAAVRRPLLFHEIWRTARKPRFVAGNLRAQSEGTRRQAAAAL